MKLLTELKVKIGYTDVDIFQAIQKKYNIFKNEIEKFEIVKESLDSRKKPDIFYSLNVAVEVKNTAKKKVLKLNDVLVSHCGVEYKKVNFNGKRPIVVGFGPAGMFVGLSLAIALTQEYLDGCGACRVHGGGFAGTIQCYVPNDGLDSYIEMIESAFGNGSCVPLNIRPVGGYEII